MSDVKQVAKIRSAFLGWEDHGILTCSLELDYGGSGQGAGNYALDAFDEAARRRFGTAAGMQFVARLMKACGVREWSDIPGRTVMAIIRDGLVRGIEPLPTEPGEALDFDEFWEAYREAAAT